MIELAKHLWFQLLHDEEAAKNRLAALKTFGLAVAAQVLVPGWETVAQYGWRQWVGAIITAGIAAGATVDDPSRAKAP